jgi:hypothetical protein
MGMSMMTHGKGRLAGTALMLTAGTFVLSGCIGGPTYGTDKTAAEQLLDDLGNVATIRPQGGDINYQPRPDLVRPPSTGALPPPQPSVAQAGSQTWPESPEQARARLVAEADAGGTNYRSPLAQRAQAGPVPPGTRHPGRSRSHTPRFPQRTAPGISSAGRDCACRRTGRIRAGQGTAPPGQCRAPGLGPQMVAFLIVEPKQSAQPVEKRHQ